MNDKTKNKRPSLAWVTIPLVILLAGGWFLWQAFQPRSISTSEGMALISGGTVEKVVLNEGTQQVNLTLSEDYHHESTGVGDPSANLGKNVYFTYSYVQTKDILDTVAAQAPSKGWNAVRPQSSALGVLSADLTDSAILPEESPHPASRGYPEPELLTAMLLYTGEEVSHRAPSFLHIP